MLCGRVGTVVMGQQAAGSVARHSEHRGMGQHCSRTQHCVHSLDQTTTDIRQDFPVQRGAGRDVLTQEQSISAVEGFLVGGHCSDVT